MLDTCTSQYMVTNSLLPEQQAHVVGIVDNGERYTYDNENGTGSVGLQHDGYTCEPGYTGLKCGVCRFENNKTSAISGVSYYRSRGICTPCIQVAEDDVTLSKMLYVMMFVAGIVTCSFLTALFLRDDFNKIMVSVIFSHVLLNRPLLTTMYGGIIEMY